MNPSNQNWYVSVGWGRRGDRIFSQDCLWPMRVPSPLPLYSAAFQSSSPLYPVIPGDIWSPPPSIPSPPPESDVTVPEPTYREWCHCPWPRLTCRDGYRVTWLDDQCCGAPTIMMVKMVRILCRMWKKYIKITCTRRKTKKFWVAAALNGLWTHTPCVKVSCCKSSAPTLPVWKCNKIYTVYAQKKQANTSKVLLV